MRAALIPHPTTGDAPPRTLTVELARDGVLLWLRFIVDGEIDRVQWPASATPGRADELWRRTCFEAFVATDDGYVEYNLSPSGQWATYRFDGYRQGMREAVEAIENDGLNDAAGVLELQARIELPLGARRLGLSCVVEHRDGGFSYWALAHPSAKPDFHHPDSFILELP